LRNSANKQTNKLTDDDENKLLGTGKNWSTETKDNTKQCFSF